MRVNKITRDEHFEDCFYSHDCNVCKTKIVGVCSQCWHGQKYKMVVLDDFKQEAIEHDNNIHSQIDIR